MRKAEVPLRVEKLATEQASRKAEQQGKAITADLYFIDPYSLFKAFLSSDVANNMHTGLAHFVDEPTELFHSHSWASSVRTTSGQFAHVLGDKTDKDGQPINLDYRSDYCTESPGGIVLQIQEAFEPASKRNPDKLPAHPVGDTVNQADNEFILNLTPTFIPETYLVSRINNKISVDYYHGETHEDPSPPIPIKPQGKGKSKPKTVYPKYEHQPTVPDRPVVVRQGFIGTEVMSLCHTHPIRAELELEVYGRDLYEKGWDHEQDRIVSCPIMVFIDGFGLYRNSYRSLIGVYTIVAALSGEDRHRQANIFPIALSPHGSNFNDTINALQSLGKLDRGVRATINGEEVVICVPTLCYIGDMPQQDKNSGFRGPKALKFCRFCHIGQAAIKSGQPNSILDFDVISHGRYHHQLIEMRRQMGSYKTATAQRGFASQWGLSEDEPKLTQLSPALDLILSRPPDPAHSEYNGMSELMHGLLMDRILNNTGSKAYTKELRYWPFPPGWERLQSPLHHLRSYSLAAHARWSVIVPGLLRRWLEPGHIHPLFMKEALSHLTTQDPVAVVNFVVKGFAKLAKSNSVLMGLKVAQSDRQSMTTIIRETRQHYQQLCLCASRAITANPRAWTQVGSRQPSMVPQSRMQSVDPGSASMPPPQSRMQSIEPGLMLPPPLPIPQSLAAEMPVPSTEETGNQAQQDGPKRAGQYMHDMMRPNVHVGIHYPVIAEEYSLPVNVNTLLGENQHRWFKKKVYETNHSSVEKLLLAKVNMQMTIRLVLRNAFYLQDGELTRQMNSLYEKCPALLDAILPRTDRRDLVEDEEGDFELDVHFGADAGHRRATVIGQIPVKVIRATTHVLNSNQPLPTHHDNMDQRFREELRRAYVTEYKQPEIYLFGHKRAQWSNKFAFTDSEFHRQTCDSISVD
ncbi:hypothetical protein V8C44DRAFT_211757 [Trichoderma aethiopicum]